MRTEKKTRTKGQGGFRRGAVFFLKQFLTLSPITIADLLTVYGGSGGGQGGFKGGVRRGYM
jgi:hypothetical protein